MRNSLFAMVAMDQIAVATKASTCSSEHPFPKLLQSDALATRNTCV